MTYTSKQVVEMVDGLTYRRLDYWVRRGFITPAVEARGSGSRRQWSEDQVEWLRQTSDSLSVLRRRNELLGDVLRGRLTISATPR